MGKKTHKVQVRVRPRQVLRAEDHSVSWPREGQVPAEHPPIGGTDDDDEQPDRLPLSLANMIGEDDQQVLHIDNIQDDMDSDGVLDCDDDDSDGLNMSEWESD
jgi:hypothetical protein